MNQKFNKDQFDALVGVCKSIRLEIDKQAGIKERFSESSAGFMYYAGEVEGLRFALQKLEDLIFQKEDLTKSVIIPANQNKYYKKPCRSKAVNKKPQ